MRLIKFNTKKNTKPGKAGGKAVVSRVSKGEGGSLDGKGSKSKAFIAKMKNNSIGIFNRTGKKASVLTIAKSFKHKNVSKYWKRTFKKSGREIIQQLHGPGVVQMLRSPEISENIQTKATERFNKELDHQIQYLLDQQKE
jgi:hypothetical protein